ncbi:MAG: hypothetical protein H6P94_1028, partial [Thermoplasmatales archaeon]|nr:hypothetical protein [Thermoplasmatales archaeon]
TWLAQTASHDIRHGELHGGDSCRKKYPSKDFPFKDYPVVVNDSITINDYYSLVNMILYNRYPFLL